MNSFGMMDSIDSAWEIMCDDIAPMASAKYIFRELDSRGAVTNCMLVGGSVITARVPRTNLKISFDATLNDSEQYSVYDGGHEPVWVGCGEDFIEWAYATTPSANPYSQIYDSAI
jgi:hypothetical protein